MRHKGEVARAANGHDTSACCFLLSTSGWSIIPGSTSHDVHIGDSSRRVYVGCEMTRAANGREAARRGDSSRLVCVGYEMTRAANDREAARSCCLLLVTTWGKSCDNISRVVASGCSLVPMRTCRGDQRCNIGDICDELGTAFLIGITALGSAVIVTAAIDTGFSHALVVTLRAYFPAVTATAVHLSIEVSEIMENCESGSGLPQYKCGRARRKYPCRSRHLHWLLQGWLK